MCDLQKSLTGLSVLFFLSPSPEGGTGLHKEIVTIYSQVVHQPPGIRRFWVGVSLLSPLRPIPRNGNPLPKFLRNSFTGERILQRPTPRHLWASDRPRMRYPICQQLPWCPAHGHTGHVASLTKKPVMIVAIDIKKIQTANETWSSYMVANGMMKVY